MLSKIREYINAPKNKRVLGFLIVLVILSALPLTVIVSQQQQEIRQRAAEPNMIALAPIFGKALSLNGNSCAEVENPTANLNFAPLGSHESFAINGWFKASSLFASYLVAREDLTDSTLQAKPSFTVGIKDGYLEFTVNSYVGSQNNSLRTAIKRSDKSLEINKWYYFMAKRDLNSIDLYINGIQQGTYELLKETSGSALDKSLTIGCQRVNKSPTDRQPTGFFNGEIDDIAISKYGASALDEVPNKPHAFQDLVLWHFDGDFKPDLGFENTLKSIGSVQFVDSTILNIIPSTTPVPTSMPTPTTVEGTSNRVFLTSTDYNGNLGGLSGADAKCQERANLAKLGGIWKAWLSDATISAKLRLAHYSNAYKLINGKVIANNWNDLTDGTLQNFINITELGTPFSRGVWTGTKPDGSRSPREDSSFRNDNCSSWTDSTRLRYASTGLSYRTDDGWTDIGRGKAEARESCSTSLALYCFEQQEIPTPSPTLTVSTCTACSADINKDGKVNSSDLTLVRRCLNKSATYATGSYTCANRDINKDGIIDILDMNCVARNFGNTCVKP